MSSFLAAKHVLDMPSVDASAFIDDDNARIDWAALQKTAEIWSTGERVMLDVALQLYNGSSFFDVKVADLFRVDDDNLRRVLEAICVKKDMYFVFNPNDHAGVGS